METVTNKYIASLTAVEGGANVTARNREQVQIQEFKTSGKQSLGKIERSWEKQKKDEERR